MYRILVAGLLLVALPAFAAESAPPPAQVRIRDIASVEGVRENPLLGYGLVVGLNGTGDRRQTVFTTQTLANVLQRLGVQISPAAVRVNNVAAVFVTASLPAFARPGTRVDITVSSVGDCKSLEGGLLLLTPLRGADGQVYAAAQGPVTLGGYSAGGAGNAKQVNHPTVARIPAGGLVERSTAIDLAAQPSLALLLAEPDFSSASSIAAAINQEFGRPLATAADGRRIDINVKDRGAETLPMLLARIEQLRVTVAHPARVVVNERTGTIVMGRDVRLGPVSILHGGLSIEISTTFSVSQPPALSGGETARVAQPEVRTGEKPVRRIELGDGATVEQLVSGLQAMGATARDVIAILQAIKAAGALEAELEVL